MLEREISSPVSRKGSRISSHQRLSPGARSAPGRGDTTERPPTQEDAKHRKPVSKPVQREPED
jgi:hypothetical protein